MPHTITRRTFRGRMRARFRALATLIQRCIDHDNALLPLPAGTSPALVLVFDDAPTQQAANAVLTRAVLALQQTTTILIP